MKPKVSETPVWWFHLKIHGGFMNCFHGFKDVAATLVVTISLII
jgi:hypothetical protein